MADVFCPHCMQSINEADAQFCPACGREIELNAEPWQLPAGTVLRGEHGQKYLFGKVKGFGGFGITYIAKELGSGEVVAIKEYYPARCCSPWRTADFSVQIEERSREIYQHGMRSFLSEASMLHAVGDVKSIVHVKDYFEANNTAYMVMEYLNGTTLADLMKTQKRFEPSLLLRKVIPLMHDLQKIHDAGVVHRDIAPDNLMLMPDGSLKLLDFGCARSMEDGRSMSVLLKPGFGPVEQYQTRGQGPFTDIYALCATVYYCLTGTLPPESPSRLNGIFDERGDPLIPCSAQGVDISPELEQMILWGMAVQPAERPQSMDQLARHIETILDAQERTTEPAVPGAGAPDAARPDGKRSGVKSLLIALAAVGAIVLLWLLLR